MTTITQSMRAIPFDARINEDVTAHSQIAGQSRHSTDHHIYTHASMISTQQQQPSRSSPGMASFRQYSYPQYAAVATSQDSINSSVHGGGRPSLKSTSSNLSTATADTDMTPPVSPARITSPGNTKPHRTAPIQTQCTTTSQIQHSTDKSRMRTPEEQSHMGREHALGSPMSVTSPTVGTKRTADGDVKGREQGTGGSPSAAPDSARHRAGSSSSSNSKAGEVRVSLLIPALPRANTFVR